MDNNLNFIPYGRQDIQQSDLDAVIKTLQSDWLTQGPAISQFEQGVAEYAGAKYSVAICNATAALHLACKALGVGKNDWVWTTPNTFVASANCALYCGASVDFIDICPKTYNLSVEKLAEKLKCAEQNNKLPKVLIPVHFAGQSCDMVEIKKLSDQYGFKIIEDASHAIGGKYLNQPIGNCEYSDITVFSFHPVKIITTAEGGMCLTNQKQLADKIALLRTHGITRDKSLMKYPFNKNNQGAWYYEQIDLGFNYRITDLQCALGYSQLERLDQYISKRHQLAQRYNNLLKNLPVKIPEQSSECYSAFHLYVIQVQDPSGHLRKQVFEYLREQKIGVNVHYIPVHLQPYYQKLGFKQGDFGESEKYYSQCLSLPLFPTLSESDQNRVVDCLKTVLEK